MKQRMFNRWTLLVGLLTTAVLSLTTAPTIKAYAEERYAELQIFAKVLKRTSPESLSSIDK